MSAEKRLKNWILVAIVLVAAILVPLIKVNNGQPAINQGIDLKGGVDLLLEAQVPEGVDEITTDMMDGAIHIVRNRLDPEGVKEITIQRLGDDRIVIQIPGEDDPERVKQLIGTTASLSFIDAADDPIPEGTHIRFVDPETGEPLGAIQPVDEEPDEEATIEEPIISTVMGELLFKPDDIERFSLSSEDEAVAEAGLVGLVVEFEFEDGLKLTVYTTQHSGEYLALLIDDTVLGLISITNPLTNNRIVFPELADDPDHDLAWFNENRDRIQIVGIAENPPEVGAVVEVFDPESGLRGLEGAEPDEEPEEEEQAIVDVSIDKRILTGDDFADADIRFDQVGQPYIAFEFKARGREIFGKHTASHVHQYLAIALDDVIISCPQIREPILGGSGQITGSFTREEVKDLVIKLDSGRLPVPLKVIENRTVSPTLGEKSIIDSQQAAILGAILILLFMAFYYRLPGLLADLALIFYVIVFFGVLSIMNATLTLPGIAGFILSVGMAVDANVIIFERLKEELKTGKTFRSATDAAFKRAFLAIFDANVTTLITALVLYNLGTGPIRGFAVTLSLGILVSMFSALVFTRLLIETILNFKKLHNYSLFGIREQDVAIGMKGGEA